MNLNTRPQPTDDRTEEARLFHEGVHLFNTGEWFEAHEAWEGIWHMASGDRKRFYQGLIQCAVTIEHIRRGNPRGVLTVYKTAVPKFRGLPEVYMGVNIPRLLAGLERVVAPIRALPPAAFDPTRPRGQNLPLNRSQVPRIELEYDPFASA